jgi:hypothetical protein
MRASTRRLRLGGDLELQLEPRTLPTGELVLDVMLQPDTPGVAEMPGGRLLLPLQHARRIAGAILVEAERAAVAEVFRPLPGPPRPPEAA